MADNETIADIIVAMRDYSNACNDGYHTDYKVVCTDMRNYADRLEAAHRREVDKLNSAIQATVSRSDAEIDRLRREIAELKRAGNVAKLREAIEAVLLAFNYGESTIVNQLPFSKLLPMLRKCIEALAAPPRNCDRFASAEEALDAYDEWVESYRANGEVPPFNEFGWLFAPATEKEGGAK